MANENKPARVYKCTKCQQRRCAKSKEVCEVCSAYEFEQLDAAYEAEYQKAYDENRDADENIIFELSVKMLSLCERWGWEIPAKLR